MIARALIHEVHSGVGPDGHQRCVVCGVSVATDYRDEDAAVPEGTPLTFAGFPAGAVTEWPGNPRSLAVGVHDEGIPCIEA